MGLGPDPGPGLGLGLRLGLGLGLGFGRHLDAGALRSRRLELSVERIDPPLLRGPLVLDRLELTLGDPQRLLDPHLVRVRARVRVQVEVRGRLRAEG